MSPEMDRHNIVLAAGSGELEMVKAMHAQAQDRFIGVIEFPRYTAPVNNRLVFACDSVQGDY